MKKRFTKAEERASRIRAREAEIVFYKTQIEEVKKRRDARVMIDDALAELFEEKDGRLYLKIGGEGADLVHEEHATIRLELDGDEPLVMVKVKNSTPEPDGSIKSYYLRVPPTMVRARQAVAWTFAVAESDYAPARET
jgi:hypothetical protein